MKVAEVCLFASLERIDGSCLSFEGIASLILRGKNCPPERAGGRSLFVIIGVQDIKAPYWFWHPWASIVTVFWMLIPRSPRPELPFTMPVRTIE